MSSIPYVFVVGCPRSGTTLLQRMLNSHPMLAVANDTHFIPSVLDKIAPKNLQLTPELVSAVHNYKRFWRLGITDQRLIEAAVSSSSYCDFVSALYQEFARTQGKDLAGEKTPDYVKRIKLLHKLFPDTKFLHIIRDGRDVALSTVEWAKADKGPGRLALWKKSPIAVCALWWQWQVDCGIEQGRPLGRNKYYEIFYEDLVNDSMDTLGRIARFLELDFDDSMLKFHEGRTRGDQNLSAKKAWLPVTSGLRTWREQMSASDISLFQTLAGETLAKLGYQLCDQLTLPDVPEETSQWRAWWQKERQRKNSRKYGVC